MFSKSGILLSLFMASSSVLTAEELPKFPLGEEIPEVVVKDLLNGTSYATFGVEENLETSSVTISSGFVDYPSGVKCTWQTQASLQSIVFENTECALIDSSFPIWANAITNNMNKYGAIVRNEPILNLTPDVSVVETMGHFLRGNAVQTLERAWNIAAGTVCLKRSEGINVPGGILKEQNFGCFPVQNRSYLNTLLTHVGVEPT